jgi:hypothetical protein
MKGTRYITIRGIFEIVGDERNFEPNYLIDLWFNNVK